MAERTIKTESDYRKEAIESLSPDSKRNLLQRIAMALIDEMTHEELVATFGIHEVNHPMDERLMKVRASLKVRS